MDYGNTKTAQHVLKVSESSKCWGGCGGRFRNLLSAVLTLRDLQQKNETRVAASVLKQAPNTYTIKNYRKIHGRHYSILPDRSGKPELQPDKYNVLMYYHLPVVLWLSNNSENSHMFCIVILRWRSY